MIHTLSVLGAILVLFLTPFVAIERLRVKWFRARWLTRQPLRSTKRDSKRYVLSLAERAYGRPVTWKTARKWANARQRIEAGIQHSKDPI